MGLEVNCVSMNSPQPADVSDEARSLLDDTTYLDKIGLLRKIVGLLMQCGRHPIRATRCVWTIFTARPMQGARDYLRLIYHFLEAGYLCTRLNVSGYSQIHSHFVNGPTSIAMFVAELSGVPFSFTMHASMIWLDPLALKNKLEKCSFCASISRYNADYIVGEYGRHLKDKIEIVHCGIDPELPSLPVKRRVDGAAFQILGVGQLNPRKGFHVLLDACRILRDNGISYRCTIVGGGEQHQMLEGRIAEYELDGLVDLAGAVRHEAVFKYLEETDLFVLPCVISDDGWRDGIPVALMEAMFHRRAVVSTRILGLPELIDDGVNGRLVSPNDPEDLAKAIAELASDQDERLALASKGRDKVLSDFNNAQSAQALARLFGA